MLCAGSVRVLNKQTNKDKVGLSKG